MLFLGLSFAQVEELKPAASWECVSVSWHQLGQTPQDSLGGQGVGSGFSRASSAFGLSPAEAVPAVSLLGEWQRLGYMPGLH